MLVYVAYSEISQLLIDVTYTFSWRVPYKHCLERATTQHDHVWVQFPVCSGTLRNGNVLDFFGHEASSCLRLIVGEVSFQLISMELMVNYAEKKVLSKVCTSHPLS